jgi:SAM-dependent methyltransferase
VSFDKLLEHRTIWADKPGLRKVYTREFFPRICSHMVPGRMSLEVGGGPGLFKDYAPDVICSDLVSCSWHDLCCDAQDLPFADATLDNVVGLDFLHHVPDPLRFLREASRVLRPKGRVVMVEPWISPLGYLLNKYFMPEELDLGWRPGCLITAVGQNKNPFDANSAVPYLLFARQNDVPKKLPPSLRLVKRERFGFLTYLLSLGFRKGSLLPGWVYGPVHSLEIATRHLWVLPCSLKVLVVLEKV